MKNSILLVLGLAMSMLLIGCGGSAEGTAKEFLEAFGDVKSDKPLTTAKASCRGEALRRLEKYMESLKDKKETAWRNDWISGAKDVDKCTDFNITEIKQLTESQSSIDMVFEFKVYRPKEKDDKNKEVWVSGRLTVALVGGDWKVTDYNFGRIR